MATVKRTNSNYVISTPLDTGSNITLSTDMVYIPGNLTVLGSTTSVSTTDTEIKDNLLRLNVGETGSGVTLGFSGIGIHRGLLANVALIWNEVLTKWQVTSDGTNFANIQTSTTGTTAVVDDLNPALGGNLNTNGKTIYANVGNINFSGNIQLNNTEVAPSLVANATVVYASTPAAGTSGVYVVNGLAANEELVTKTRAFGFSLIL